MVDAAAAFVPLDLPPVRLETGPIVIEVRRGRTAIHVEWPVQAADACVPRACGTGCGVSGVSLVAGAARWRLSGLQFHHLLWSRGMLLVSGKNRHEVELPHSGVTAMLRDGLSLSAIGALLRHSSIEATAVYAKVDVNLRKEVVQPWPGVRPC